MPLELVFLGTSAAIQVPSFHCTCEVCEAARKDPKHRRTRASVALLGEETVLIDASPDMEFQLEREAIRRIDRIFLTHWHFDHVWGLAALGEPGLPDLVVEMFRSRLRWYGAVFLVMILLFTVLAVICAARFLAAEEVPDMIRWGAGFFLCFGTVLSGKLWYWMQMERVAMTREIKRVELLVAHLAAERGSRRAD